MNLHCSDVRTRDCFNTMFQLPGFLRPQQVALITGLQLHKLVSKLISVSRSW